MAMPMIRSTPLTPTRKGRVQGEGRRRTQVLAAKAEALYEAAESLPEVANELHQLAQPYLDQAATESLRREGSQ